MTRSRYIPKNEKIAALLIKQLPSDVQNDLYDRKVPAEQILSMFEWDHWPHRFVDGGPNEWWNIRPLSPDEHKKKTARDKAELAKTDRLHGRTKQGPKKKIRSRNSLSKEARKKMIDYHEARNRNP